MNEHLGRQGEKVNLQPREREKDTAIVQFAQAVHPTTQLLISFQHTAPFFVSSLLSAVALKSSTCHCTLSVSISIWERELDVHGPVDFHSNISILINHAG